MNYSAKNLIKVLEQKGYYFKPVKLIVIECFHQIAQVVTTCHEVP